MEHVEPTGFLVECPNCNRELRISRKYVRERVQCKFCDGQFRLELNSPNVHLRAFYAECPHCGEELRAADKYLGSRVACKLCGGKLKFPGRDECANV